MEAAVHEKILDERLAALERARAWSPRVISKLESHIRTADDVALFRINPIRFAAEKNIAEAETIDLFLHGAFLGLFEMDWLLLCSACSCVVESFGSLKGVRNQFHCAMCRTDLEAALDDYIAVAFTVSPQIRSIAFHRPASLSAQDFAFAYKLTDEGLLPDGTPFVQMLRSWTSTVSYLPTGMTQLEVDAKEGLLHAWGPDTDAGFDFRVEGEPATSPQTVRIRYLGNHCEPAAGTVAPGRIVFEIENDTGQQGFLGISAVPAKDLPILEISELDFVSYLSGSRLLATQTFRDLFRSETIRAVEGIGAACRLDRAQPMATYVPELAAIAAWDRVTLEHVLDMATGLEFDEHYENADSMYWRYTDAVGYYPRDAQSQGTTLGFATTELMWPTPSPESNSTARRVPTIRKEFTPSAWRGSVIAKTPSATA